MQRKSLITLPLIALVGAALCFVTSCGKEEAPKSANETPAAKPAAHAIVSADKNSFAEVTAQLDPGGDLYAYLSTEQLLQGISGAMSNWSRVFAAMPNASEHDRDQIAKVFNIVTSLVNDSGIQDVSGFGISSIATDKRFYRTKTLLHHYPGRGTGFLWKLFGQQPHALAGLDLLPTNTVLAAFSDVDAGIVWAEIQKQVKQSGIPEAQKALDQLPTEFEKNTGLKLDQVLNSLGGEVGVIVTLDESKQIPIPIPQSGQLQIPEPALLIFIRVNDDTIFNRVDAELTKVAGQQLVRVDEPNLKMRTVAVPLPLPIQLRPTIASTEHCLLISTSDAMIRQVLAVKAGQLTSLKSTDEFKRMAMDVPLQGNQFTFVSPRLGQAAINAQRQLMSNAASNSAQRQQWLDSLWQPSGVNFSFCVGANTDIGLLSVGNASEHPAKMLLVPAVLLPAGIVAGIAVPNFIKARETSQRNACINNLRQIDAAKKQWQLEKNKKDSDTPTQSELREYLRTWPQCPAGGHYTIGAAGDVPTCSIAGHKLGE